MRTRTGDAEEDQEKEGEELAPVNGDLGAILMGVQDSAGNAALAGLVAQVESRRGRAGGAAARRQVRRGREGGRARAQGHPERGTHLALTQRLTKAKAHARAPRIEGELTAFERRLRDAREYGWIGMDAAALGAEMDELEDKLARAEAEEEALAALASVDLRRKPLSERIKKAIMERTAIAKPGMALYAPEDLEDLGTIGEELTEVQKALTENTIAVVTSRQTLGALSAVATEFARTRRRQPRGGVEKSAVEARRDRAQAQGDHRAPRARERRGPRQAHPADGRPRAAPAPGAAAGDGRRLEHQGDRLPDQEGLARAARRRPSGWPRTRSGSSSPASRPTRAASPTSSSTERMGEWRIHLSLDYGVMKAVDVDVLGVRRPRRDLRRERRRRAALARHRRGARPQRRPQPALLLRHRQASRRSGTSGAPARARRSSATGAPSRAS